MKQLLGVATALLVLAGTTVLGGEGKGRLAGKWVATAMEFKGQKKSAPDNSYMLVFGPGDKITMKGGKEDEQGTYKADPSKKPAHLDITTKKGAKNETMRGIYEVTGDTLKIGFPFGGPEKPRPKDFTAEGTMIMYLKKQK